MHQQTRILPQAEQTNICKATHLCIFDFVVPTELPGVDPKILDPRDTYADAAQWDEKAKDLAGRFIKNFAKFTGNEAGKKLVAAGPKL